MPVRVFLATTVIAALSAVVALVAPAQADIFRVDMFASAQNYSGACPVDIVFTATVDGDPGTVIKYSFSGTRFAGKKPVYGYIPTSGTTSLEDDVIVDAAHAGTFDRTVSVTAYSQGGQTPGKTMTSTAAGVVVACVVPGQSPLPAPSSSQSPATSVAFATGSPAAASTAIGGVSIGDDPATVLARLHLHPPGWAKPPKGSAFREEVRQFSIDGGRAVMMLAFDRKIDVVVVSEIAGRDAGIVDPSGIAFGSSLEAVEALRGKPDLAIDPSACQSGCATIDEMPVWKGLSAPIPVDHVVVYGPANGLRWEYAIAGDRVVSIRVFDCSALSACATP